MIFILTSTSKIPSALNLTSCDTSGNVDNPSISYRLHFDTLHTVVNADDVEIVIKLQKHIKNVKSGILLYTLCQYI